MSVIEHTVSVGEHAFESSANVALLWWPKTTHFAFTHIKLAVEGMVWNCHEGTYEHFMPLEQAKARALTHPKGRGVFVIQVKISQEEQTRLCSFLQQPTSNGTKLCSSNLCACACVYHTCIGGITKALKVSQTKSLQIWPVLPILVITYLTVRAWRNPLNYAVHYIGPTSPFRNLCSWHVLVEILALLVFLAIIGEVCYFGVERFA